MCHDLSSRPPLPPIGGGAGAGPTEELVLEAKDGNRFAAFSARSAVPGGPGIVILPDVRGLHPFYKDLALRFAEMGVHALAMDYFGRTAGTDARDDDFEFMPHVQKTTPDSIAMDVSASVDHLRSERGGGVENVYTVGFCFGGRNSFNQAARDHGLAGVIGFYGRVQAGDAADTNAPTLLAPSYKVPVLGLFGGADPGIPADAVERFRKTLDAAGVANEIVIYDGAPHSFFDRSFDEHRNACDEAWIRILRFLGRAPAETMT
jgi:carboxymethylenebutenolidase